MNVMQRDRKDVVKLTLDDGTTLLIRRYHEDDLAFIYEIEELCFSPDEQYTARHLEMLGEFQIYSFLVAEMNNRIIGYTVGVIKSTKEGPMGHIVSIAVHPNYRRRGIGLGLVNELMGQLKDAGASYFRLEVKKTNKVARNMYRKLGFVESYILRNYYGAGKDAIVMKMSA